MSDWIVERTTCCNREVDDIKSKLALWGNSYLLSWEIRMGPEMYYFLHNRTKLHSSDQFYMYRPTINLPIAPFSVGVHPLSVSPMVKVWSSNCNEAQLFPLNADVLSVQPQGFSRLACFFFSFSFDKCEQQRFQEHLMTLKTL